MSDLISRQAAIDIERNATVDTNPSHFEAHQKFTHFMDDAEISSFGRWQWSNGFNTALTAVGIDLKKLPTVDAEPTEEHVKEYCRKRCLVIVTNELFNEIKARWSAEPVRHGHWVENNGRYGWYCSQCKKENNYAYDYNENNVIELQDHYCPNCGAKMDESTMGQVKQSDGERKEDGNS